ncbi:hypothetical protein TTHERM_00827070 (macronuclear) [Tetrahymena thermophila SB210]|uniref:Kinase domain protein n=1 Tax=Tetrahymena thermophila (strain SB210) TaxID=312017 RepID=Q22EG2_TETTS|nr:hypothetical protein TTHERM_00827070 [Tetrahymena thermophila SB210]EAR83690.1 hypothetical protein TTHERM_00827070 [Tetrahymena thermophila SB210]|eukprot:XP_001031353.1 hypothetical protein TTHERM_00827070 [Tetrahymena thermophila SB210]
MFNKQFEENEKIWLVSDQHKWIFQQEQNKICNIDGQEKVFSRILQLHLINHDQVNVELIETIKSNAKFFRNLQSLVICFDGMSNLQEDEQIISNLFSVLQIFKNLEEIIISLNKVQLNSSIINALGQLIAKQAYAKYLTLHYCESNITSQLQKDLLNYLVPLQNQLESISLDISSNQVNQEGAKLIGQFVKQCSKLRLFQLIAARNSLNAKSANLLTKALYYCTNLTHIEIDISFNLLIDNLEVVSIGQIFSSSQNLECFKINLNHIHLQDDILKKLQQYITSYLKKIHTISLQMNDNSFSPDRIYQFAYALSECKTLKNIDLIFKNNTQYYTFIVLYSIFKNNTIDPNNLTAFSDQITLSKLVQNETLNLNFTHSEFGENGSALLKVALPPIQKLKSFTLNLCETHIGNKAMVDICLSLKMDFLYLQVLKFDFSHNYIGYQGINQLCQVLLNCVNTKSLSLSFEKVGLFDNEISPLIYLLPKLVKLQHLYLNLKDNPKLSLSMLLKIILQIKNHKQMRYVDLQYYCALRQINLFDLQQKKQISKVLMKLLRLVTFTNK